MDDDGGGDGEGADTAAGSATDDGSPDAPRSRARIAVGVVVVVVVLAAAAAAIVRIVALTDDRDTLREHTAELEESLRIARGDAGAQIEQLENTIAALDARTDELDGELASTSEALEASEAEVDGLEARLDRLRGEHDDALELIDELEAILDEVGREFEPMPDLLGAEQADAEAFAELSEAELMIDEAAPGNVIARPGTIIDQRPIDGTIVLPGTLIWVQIFTPEADEEE